MVRETVFVIKTEGKLKLDFISTSRTFFKKIKTYYLDTKMPTTHVRIVYVNTETLKLA